MLEKEIEYLGYMLDDIEVQLEFMCENRDIESDIRPIRNKYEVLNSIRKRLQKL